MRNYRDWQFFNRKPEGSYRLMQACYIGRLWEVGFGFNPARVWLSRLRETEHKYLFHFHCYLPLARHFNSVITYFGRISIGWRYNGKWHQIPRRVL